MTVQGEDQAHRDARIARNDDRRHRRDARHDRRHPRINRNLASEFIQEVGGVGVYAAPSANLAAAHLELEGIPETPELNRIKTRLTAAAGMINAQKATASSSHHSRTASRLEASRGATEESDLRQRLRRIDLRKNLDERHRRRDEEELRRRAEYNRNHGAPGLDRDTRLRRELEANEAARRREFDRKYGPPRDHHRPPRARTPDDFSADSGRQNADNLNDCDGFLAFTA